MRKIELKFQSYGVKIGVRTDIPAHLESVRNQLRKVFPNGIEELDGEPVEYQFYIKSIDDETAGFYKNEELLFETAVCESFFEMVESQIRLTVAEFAVGKVFLHAGVVGWNNRAIIIPATSFSGKTTLVAELVKQGALYYSDEYAVLDADGNVEPFPKWLSMRGIIDDFRQLDCSVESIGGVAGTKPIPVGMILYARFDKNKLNPRRWQPRKLSDGQAMMEILPHTMPIRNKPKFTLDVLNKMIARAIIVRTVRGDAKEFANILIKYFESRTT